MFEKIRYGDQFRTFWAGLKRSCDHTDLAKHPIMYPDLESILDSILKRDVTTNAQIRDACWVMFCYYGVRRVSEGQGLNVGDFEEVPGGVKFRVVEQKNHLGQKYVFIPDMAHVKYNPIAWLTLWRQKCSEYGLGPNDPFFFTTKGAKKGSRAYANNVRRYITDYYGNENCFNTQSLRKGGCIFWYLTSGDMRLSQAQGQWKSADTMKQVYLGMKDQELIAAAKKVTRVQNICKVFAKKPVKSRAKKRATKSVTKKGSKTKRVSKRAAKAGKRKSKVGKRKSKVGTRKTKRAVRRAARRRAVKRVVKKGRRKKGGK